jgi:sulfide:quinone oxidoreductase
MSRFLFFIPRANTKMTTAIQLTDTLWVAGQISPEDLKEAAHQGVRSIICNRPDGESADQYSYQEIETAAKALGLEVAYCPVVSGRMTEQDVATFKHLIAQMPTPQLAYCRSGMRSTCMWALSQASHHPAAEIIATAANAGYDLSPLQAKLEMDFSLASK